MSLDLPPAPTRRLAVWTAYCVPPVLAVLSTWPLAARLRSHVALGPYGTSTVSLTTEWTLWWNADRLAHGLAGYWDAPIFAPALGTFALSEPQPLSGLVFALPYALTGSLELAYGVVLLFTLSLNGWTMLRLLRRARVTLEVAALGGAMTTLLPFVHTELSVLPFIALGGALLALEAWLAFQDAPSWGRGALLGAALGASYLMTCQLTLLFVLILALALPFTMSREHLRRRVLVGLGVGALVCAAIVAPLAVRQLEVTRSYHLERSESVARDLSAGLNRYGRPPFRGLVPFLEPPAAPSPRRWFFPGTVKVALAAAGVWLAVTRREAPRLVRLGLPLLFASVLVGLGPLARAGPLSPYAAFAAVVPGFRQIRGLFHVAAFAQVAVVLLAAHGLDTLRRATPMRLALARDASAWGRRWATACLLTGALAAVELWPRGQRFFAPPSLDGSPAWIDWITAHTPVDATLAFVPFPASGKVEAFEPTAEWMRFGARLHRRLVNGYSSYFPESNRRLARAMRDFPAGGSLDALRGSGVTTLVVDLRHHHGPLPDLPRALLDERAQMAVYRLPR